MSYKNTLNQIDIELKKLFNIVDINTNQGNVDIQLSSSIIENVNNNLKMNIIINKHNLNQTNPILEWSYYTDTNKKDNIISFNTPINEMISMINTITTTNRFSREYLDTLISEQINESLDTDISDSIIFETIYSESDNILHINKNDLKTYFKSIGFIIEDIVVSYFDNESGKPKGVYIGDEPQLGDDNELSLKNISSTTYEGDITPKDWLKIENELNKLPHLEEIYVSTVSNSVLVNISNEVYVELV